MTTAHENATELTAWVATWLTKVGEPVGALDGEREGLPVVGIRVGVRLGALLGARLGECVSATDTRRGTGSGLDTRCRSVRSI